MRTVTMILALFLTTQVQAVNLLWMHRAPVSYFTASDWDLLDQTMKQALSNDANNVTAEWTNPETGHSGTITPRGHLTLDGLACREVRFTNETPKASGRLDVTLCPGGDDEWQIHSTSRAATGN